MILQKLFWYYFHLHIVYNMNGHPVTHETWTMIHNSASIIQLKDSACEVLPEKILNSYKNDDRIKFIKLTCIKLN